jgi:hypothetical protein
MSIVRCFACGEMGHYAGQCSKKKKKQLDGTTTTTEEEEFSTQLRGSCLSVDIPSNGWCADKVKENPQIESVVSRGMKNQFSRTPSSGVTSPPETTLVSELPNRQLVGVEAS